MTLKQSMQEYKNNNDFENDEDDIEQMQEGADAISKYLECSEEEILDLCSPTVSDEFPFDLVPKIFNQEFLDEHGFFAVDESLIKIKLFEVTGHPGSHYVNGGILPNGSKFCEWSGANWDGPYIFIKA